MDDVSIAQHTSISYRMAHLSREMCSLKVKLEKNFRELHTFLLLKYFQPPTSNSRLQYIEARLSQVSSI